MAETDVRGIVSALVERHGTGTDGGEAAEWNVEMWRDIADHGFALVGVAETAGGSGGELADLTAVLQAVGYTAAPLPIAETATAGWALAAAGMPVPRGPLAFVIAEPDGPLQIDAAGTRARGEARRVLFGRRTEHVVVVATGAEGTAIGTCPTTRLEIREGRGLSGEPVDDLVLPEAGVELHRSDGPLTAADAESRLLLAHAHLMIGALQRVVELTVHYAEQRVQFGRPLAGFQAVAQLIATLVEVTRQVETMTELATRAVSRGDDNARNAVLAAKVCADEAALTAYRVGHQVHGAMGVTEEYPLHRFTRRLLAWRASRPDSHPTELASAIHRVGAAGLWRQMTSEGTT